MHRNLHRNLRKSGNIQRPLTYVDVDGIFLVSINRLSLLDTYLPKMKEVFEELWRCQQGKDFSTCLQLAQVAANLHACAHETMLSAAKASLESKSANTFDLLTRAACQHAVKAVQSGLQLQRKRDNGELKRLLVIFEEALRMAEAKSAGSFTFGFESQAAG